MMPKLLVTICAFFILNLVVWSAKGTARAQTPSAVPTASPSAAPTNVTPSAAPASATPPALPLIATPAQLALPPGQPTSIAVTGGSGAITAAFDNRIARIDIDQTSRTVTLTAIVTRATATLHISDQTGQTIDVRLRVAPNAGTIPKSITVKLTGDSIDSNFVASQITLALLRETQVQMGAVPSFGPIQFLGQALTPGGVANLAIPVTISGGDQYLDVSDTTNIRVQNVSATPFSPTLLFFSDDPEHIVSDGVLARATLSAQQPIRLYDYHENGLQPRRLVLAFSSAAPSSVHVIESFAGPNMDVMTVGHVVTRNFLTYKPHNVGTIVDLNADVPILYRDVAMGPRDGVANNVDLRVLSGGPVTVTVLAVSAGIAPATLLNAPKVPGDTHNRQGVFPLTGFGQHVLQYQVGAEEPSVDIGDREPTLPDIDPKIAGHDYGDYGVLHQMSIKMNNPTDQPAPIYLFMLPRGGPVRSTYLIDNDTVPFELGCVRAQNPVARYLLRSYTLPARGTLQSRILTMAEGGSNYPITIGVSAVAPQPTAPPIFSPTGCFPKPQQAPPPPSTSATPSPLPTP
ncbi:MAG: hypothetical protein M3Z14_06080 [Candidatus Eremiobacteraeota bacterium]|nr:hypothetical protein [Candidatus Eremiobacteraeota bacterium]